MLQALYVPMLTTDKTSYCSKKISDVGSPVNSYSNETIYRLQVEAERFLWRFKLDLRK